MNTQIKTTNIFLPVLLLMAMVMFSLQSCEEELDVDLPDDIDKIVVEGWIDQGNVPLVILTRNTPFFGTLSFEDIDDFFVHDAKVTISDGVNTNVLKEYSFAELDLIGNASFYSYDTLDFLNGVLPIIGEAGTYYDLTIETEGKTLTSRTKIPNSLPIDSIWWEARTIGDNDSLARVLIEMQDPDTLGNFYRYFTQRNQEPVWPAFNSVFDDKVINGLSFPTIVDRGFHRADTTVNFDNFGLFNLGDTVMVRLSNIDERVYDYWNTLETNSSGGGAFTGITVVDSNIEGEGGAGVWAGYAIQEKTIIIPPKGE